MNGREEIAAAFKCLPLEEQLKKIGTLYVACGVLEVKIQRLREREAWLIAEQEEGVSKNIFLTEEEWQQRMYEARREIEAAQARLEEGRRELALAIAEREARDKRGKV